MSKTSISKSSPADGEKAKTYQHDAGPSSNPGKLKAIGGSDNDRFNNLIANSAFRATWLAGYDDKGKDDQLCVVVSALAAINPRDEVEGLLAAQMVTTHNATMDCYRRAAIDGQTFEARQMNLNYAIKLSRCFATLLETLDRHRGKGQQKVTVEHVHVHEGGQAIVGNVSHPEGGGSMKLKEQSHAPKSLAAPDGSALPCTFEADKDAVPESRREG